MPTLAQILAARQAARVPGFPPDQPENPFGPMPKYFQQFPYPPNWMTPGVVPRWRDYITRPPLPRQQDQFINAFAYHHPWEPGWGRSGWSYGTGGLHDGNGSYGLQNWMFPPWNTNPNRGNPYATNKGVGRV